MQAVTMMIILRVAVAPSGLLFPPAEPGRHVLQPVPWPDEAHIAVWGRDSPGSPRRR